MGVEQPDFSELIAKLHVIDEELADLAMDALRQSIYDEGDSEAEPDSSEGKKHLQHERQITRARRSIEKAVSILESLSRS